jgi:ABC-2 type transport system permease protein
MEIALTLRRGESLLVTIGIPVAILFFFTIADVLPHRGRAIDFLMPGVLALAVVSSAMTSLGIATGFERQSGVLRRIGVTPLGRDGLLIAKIVSVGFVCLLQTVALVGIGLALGWHARVAPFPALAAFILGIALFTAIGFTLAGRLRAETNLAAANGLFLVLLLAGGIVVPVARLPAGLRSFARVLPTDPFVASLRSSLVHGSADGSALLALFVWTLVLSLIARRAFRWD